MIDTGYRSNQIMETLGMRGLQSHETMIENQLKKHGLRLGDVRYVLHTHLHIDHAGKDDLFPDEYGGLVINRRELEYSVSGLIHPRYRPSTTHLIDRLHTKGALRLLDLEMTGPIRLMPGLTCEAAGGHTEGSMNIIVRTNEGDATICGDVIYDINDQIVEPFREISDMEPRYRQPRHDQAPGEGGDQKGARALAPRSADPRPAGDDRGRTGGRPPAATRSRADCAVAAATQWFPA